MDAATSTPTEGAQRWQPASETPLDAARPQAAQPPVASHSRLDSLRRCAPACLGGGHFSRTEQARQAVLYWRLTTPYLVYCVAFLLVVAFLMTWNCIKGFQHHWHLQRWFHYRWEETIEVLLGGSIIVETVLSMWLVGIRNFFRNPWCVFDFFVMLLSTISVGYALEHLGHIYGPRQACAPLLVFRFVLLPARVVASLAIAVRAREMQKEVQETPVVLGGSWELAETLVVEGC